MKMKRLLLSLGLLGVVVFALNALIVTGHLSVQQFGESADSDSPASDGRDARSAPITLEVQADSPTASPVLQGTAPSPTTEHAEQSDADEHSLTPVSESFGEIAPAGTELAAIGASAAVIRAAPSASAAGLFAFPLGRRVRVGERLNGFARIEDLASGEVGWVEEAALGSDALVTQRSKRDSYADATIERPAVSKPREKGRWARKRGHKGGLFRRLIGRR